MSKQFLYDAYICSLLKQVCCKAVSEHVRSNVFSYLRLARSFSYELLDVSRCHRAISEDISFSVELFCEELREYGDAVFLSFS